MRFFNLIILSILVLSLSGGLAHAKNEHAKKGHVEQEHAKKGYAVKEKENMKYRGVDRNHDGVVTREEWRGNDQSFGNHDWNGDGVLSGDEVRPGARQPLTGLDRFGELDDNSNGFVSREEWNNTARSFDRLDRNSDGRLNRDEFYNGSRIPIAVFSEIDVNNDGSVSPGEWRGDIVTFNRLDVDGNDLLSEDEFNGRQRGGLIEQVFLEIFKGR